MYLGCHSDVILDTILMSVMTLKCHLYVWFLDVGIQNGRCVIICEFSKNIYGAASKILEFWRGIIFTEVYIKFIHKKNIFASKIDPKEDCFLCLQYF